jgi:diadenosine tetraphosphatase ApaH/serine/threonine PP2A family protein phosphatase
VRLAVFSDVHGNLEALDAVLASPEFRAADRSVCLGDVVGYGADPSACLARVREETQHLLLGNHESAVIHPEELAYFNGYARQAIEWTRDKLTEEERAFLASLPFLHRESPRYLFVHAGPSSPSAWDYVYDLATAQREVGAFEESLCCVGHSHVPLAIEIGEAGSARGVPFPVVLHDGCRYLVNVGSVGQPRDGDPRPAFVTVDEDARRVDLVRVDYAIEKAQEKIVAAELPAFLAARLAKGR